MPPARVGKEDGSFLNEPRIEPPSDWLEDGFPSSSQYYSDPEADLAEALRIANTDATLAAKVDVEDDSADEAGDTGPRAKHSRGPKDTKNMSFLDPMTRDPMGFDPYGDPHGMHSMLGGLHDDLPPIGGVEEVELGTQCEVKVLYEGPSKCQCCDNWVEKAPKGMETNASKTTALHGGFACVARKSTHGSELELHSIIVQSPQIISCLKTVLKDYPGLMITDTVTLSRPFEPVFHNWAALNEECNKAENSGEFQRHVRLFLDTVLPGLEQHFKAFDAYLSTGMISFESVWTIFSPGQLVLWTEDGEHSLGHLREAVYVEAMMGTKIFEVCCKQVDWDGKQFGYLEVAMTIKPFKGSRNVGELTVMPLKHHSSADSIKIGLIERGRAFELLKGSHFRAYNGVAIWANSWGSQVHQQINDRVIIDAYAFYHFQQKLSPMLSSLDEKTSAIIDPYDPYAYPHGPPRDRAPRREMSRDRETTSDRKESAEIRALTDDELMLCTPFVRGFALRARKFCRLKIVLCQDIQWRNALSSLVLPPQQKDLLVALSRTKLGSEAQNFDDFIDGKGKGVIICLSGPPGVGKTLTAESIAEEMHVPLYTLSAGEIGTVPREVEAELKSTFEKCEAWNAILLIDEADVFLEKRNLNSLKRNELVSIFLRLLEYYQGIMFLTTNRVEIMDPAFESRIDVSIAFSSLTPALREQIWINHLTKYVTLEDAFGKWINRLTKYATPEGAFGKEDISSLAEKELNGRQIKSAIKVALILAGSKGRALALEDIKTVLQTRETHN